MEKYITWTLGCMMLFLVMFGASFIIALIVMWIWNLVVVPAFAVTTTLPVLSYWQTFWIIIMIKFILAPITLKQSEK